jgi:hypothetical protein
VNNEKKLAKYLGLKQNSISSWKTQNTIPYKHIDIISENTNKPFEYFLNDEFAGAYGVGFVSTILLFSVRHPSVQCRLSSGASAWFASFPLVCLGNFLHAGGLGYVGNCITQAGRLYDFALFYNFRQYVYWTH